MIGQGFMGRAHSNAFQQVNRFFDTPYELRRKVICGRDAARLQDMASRWGWEETETQWQAIIERKDIQVVDIATPNNLHAEIAIAAAQAGKIVLCEKPLARNLEEAQRMAEAAKRVPNLVWFNYRRVPAVALAKCLWRRASWPDLPLPRRLLAELGSEPRRRWLAVQSFGSRFRRRWRPARSPGGHCLAPEWSNFRIERRHAYVREGREVDDAVLLQARFENGSIGTFEATRFAIGCQNQNTFEIHGSGGMIRFNLEDLNHLEFFDADGSPRLQGVSDILVTNPIIPTSVISGPPAIP